MDYYNETFACGAYSPEGLMLYTKRVQQYILNPTLPKANPTHTQKEALLYLNNLKEKVEALVDSPFKMKLQTMLVSALSNITKGSASAIGISWPVLTSVENYLKGYKPEILDP